MPQYQWRCFIAFGSEEIFIERKFRIEIDKTIPTESAADYQAKQRDLTLLEEARKEHPQAKFTSSMWKKIN